MREKEAISDKYHIKHTYDAKFVSLVINSILIHVKVACLFFVQSNET